MNTKRAFMNTLIKSSSISLKSNKTANKGLRLQFGCYQLPCLRPFGLPSEFDNKFHFPYLAQVFQTFAVALTGAGVVCRPVVAHSCLPMVSVFRPTSINSGFLLIRV